SAAPKTSKPRRWPPYTGCNGSRTWSRASSGIRTCVTSPPEQSTYLLSPWYVLSSRSVMCSHPGAAIGLLLRTPLRSVTTSSPPRRRRLIERLDLSNSQREGKRFGIAGRLPAVLRTGDRQDAVLFHEPPQRHLRRGLGMTFTDLPQQGHHRLRLLEAITPEVA